MASLLVIAGLVYVGLCAWVYAMQRAQICFPTPESEHPGTKVLWIE